jgi:hypothetical protein
MVYCELGRMQREGTRLILEINKTDENTRTVIDDSRSAGRKSKQGLPE